jgi:hypothetical protein
MSWDHKYTMVLTLYVSFLVQKTIMFQCTSSVVSEINKKPLKLILPDWNMMAQLHRQMYHNSIGWLFVDQCYFLQHKYDV